MIRKPCKCLTTKNINLCALAVQDGDVGSLRKIFGGQMQTQHLSSGSGPHDKEPTPTPHSLCKGGQPECPPQDVIRPSQNDPYRIKVPDAAVPPMPVSKAKPLEMCPCKRGGPCAPRVKLCLPPPPPPPPPPPFPWHYIWPFGAIMAFFGTLYHSYLWKKESDKKSEAPPVWLPRTFKRNPRYATELPESVKYLIIGAGTAGMAAYSAIMKFDPCAKVFIITQEDILPYEKPPLAKGIWLMPKPPDVSTLLWMDGLKRISMYLLKPSAFLDPVEFYRKKYGPAVSVAYGWKVVRVDADSHEAFVVATDKEQPIRYEKCVIATGSKSKNLDLFRTAPFEVRQKVCKLRTIRDVEVAWRKLENAKRCVIIGGGPLGTELSWTLGELYNKMEHDEDYNVVEVVHIIKDKGILSAVIPDYLAEWSAEKLKDQDVVLVPKAEVYDAYINPENERLVLTLSTGKELETDYVFVCVGAEPQTELAEPSELELDSETGGFLVNTEMLARTDLYVAGDAASHYQQWKGTRERHQHYMSAVETGCLAGENMTGRWTAFNAPEHFQIRLGDQIHMEAVGEVDACMTTIGVFAKCHKEEKLTKAQQLSATAAQNVPCYKKSEEYKMRYEKGLIFYMRDEYIKGIAFWNVDKNLLPDRKDVCVEILRAEPTFEDIETITDLLHFHEDSC